jgi:hypothetical protein
VLARPKFACVEFIITTVSASHFFLQVACVEVIVTELARPKFACVEVIITTVSASREVACVGVIVTMLARPKFACVEVIITILVSIIVTTMSASLK